jgi:DNA-binding MarR family transcriptional regulator
MQTIRGVAVDPARSPAVEASPDGARPAQVSRTHPEPARNAGDRAPAAATETGPNAEVAAFEGLTRVLVGLAWHSAHAAEPDLTVAQTRLLLTLNDLGRVSSSRLAAVLGVNASSVTRMADKLELIGFLDRRRHERNRSVVTVEVSPAGRQLVRQVIERRHAALHEILDQMTLAERRLAADSARRFTAAAAHVSTVDTFGPGPL